MTTQEALGIAGSWTAWDPEYTDRPQWHECLRRALEELGPDGDWRARAISLYRRPLFEVFKRHSSWYVQMPKGILAFRLKRTAVKFADANRELWKAAGCP